MRPSLAVNYGIDNWVANTVFAGQVRAYLARRVPLANLAHPFFGQLGVNIICSDMHARFGAALARTVLHIVSSTSQPQVRRINARRIVARVTDIRVRGDRAIVQFVRKAMRAILFFASPERSVSSRLFGPLPQPTIIWAALVHLFPETIGGRARLNVVILDESSLPRRKLGSGERLPTSTFAQFWGIIGAHENLHFSCHVPGRYQRRWDNFIGCYRSILAQMGCVVKYCKAVLHGVGTAKKWLAEVGPNPYLFAAKRMGVYTRMDNWSMWGAGWVNRLALLFSELGQDAAG